MMRLANPRLPSRTSRWTVKQRSIRGRDDSEHYIRLPTLRESDDSFSSNDERKPRKLPWYQINWQSYTRSGNPAILFWVSMTVLCILFFADGLGPSLDGGSARILNMDSSKKQMVVPAQEKVVELVTTPIEEKVKITFDVPAKIINKMGSPKTKSRGNVALPPLEKEKESPVIRDFGGLEFTPRANFKDPIPIDDKASERQREDFLEYIDDSDDEDYHPTSSYEDEYEKCRSATWAAYTFPTCNQIHEKTIGRFHDNGYEVSYLNSGTYRDAFRFRREKHPADHFVMKRLLFRRSVGSKEIYKIHKEAIILERLSPSPRVLDIYGHCGTSVLLEPMASDLHTKIVINDYGLASQTELDKLDNVYPLNNLTASEKLEISLEMARSLADLHGFEGGPIVHSDTHIEQWLIAPDGSVKLNDFNNAHESTWNEKTQSYCTRHGSYGGTYRSPEEFAGTEQDESVDTYALGSNIYTMITGLWPFYDEEYREISSEKIREQIINGKRAFIDPRYRTRSFIEGSLIKVMEQCWTFNRRERPSIFEVVSSLEKIKEEAIQRGELHKSPLIKIPMPQ